MELIKVTRGATAKELDGLSVELNIEMSCNKLVSQANRTKAIELIKEAANLLMYAPDATNIKEWLGDIISDPEKMRELLTKMTRGV